MNVLDLFSGIGGFSLGLERAGMRTVAFCERDEYCRAVLRKHWPGVPCFDDIHTIDADRLDRLGPIDLVCGGFPCQPFSVAGEQKGKADDRHLWPQMRRIIALARPAWVIGENVTGLVAMALDDVLADLEGLGYTARTFVIPACAVGAPHRRDRLWIVATNTDSEVERSASRNAEPRNSGEALRERAPESGRRSSSAADADGSGQPEHGECNCGTHAGSEGPCRHDVGRCSQVDVADASGAGLQRSGHVGGTAIGTTAGQSVLSGTGDGRHWLIEPDVGRVAHGVPKRVDRIRSLGNSVVPQIVEEIGRAIIRTTQQL